MSKTTQAIRPDAELQALREIVSSAGYTDCAKLHKLSNIVKLAAFASEARRTLEGMERVLGHFPQTLEATRTHLKGSSDWVDMDDVTGEVLQDVAAQLDKLSDAIGNRPAGLYAMYGPGGADHG